MAKTSIQTEPIEDEKLKYLEFVRIAALHAVLCLCSFYVYAKENSGPLRPRVGSAERAARAVVEPFYARYRGVPLELLKVADRKVDDLLGEVNRHMPTLVKSASAKAYSAAQKAPEVARSVAGGRRGAALWRGGDGGRNGEACPRQVRAGGGAVRGGRVAGAERAAVVPPGGAGGGARGRILRGEVQQGGGLRSLARVRGCAVPSPGSHQEDRQDVWRKRL